MYAIVETGGKQYRVKPGDTIAVERVAGEPGEVLDLGRVLLVAGDGDAARVGSPGTRPPRRHRRLPRPRRGLPRLTCRRRRAKRVRHPNKTNPNLPRREID